MIGDLLCERYNVTDILSTGGMSQTYMAQDTQRPGNPVCIVKQLKLISNTSNAVEKTRQLFKKEAEILERLGNNDQIPRLLASFEQEQAFYLVQEFIEGHTLDHEMHLGERWLEAQVIQFLQDILRILEFVHAQNVVHLDIKPANIIRRQSDQKLVLIDFGAVKQIQGQPTVPPSPGQTQATVLSSIGTPGYMPTEQAIGKPSLSSDIYALGMTAIQAITGILPQQLREDDNGEIIWQSQADVSDELATVLSKMVRHFHKQRYQSAAEVLQALQQSGLDASPESTPLPSATETSGRTSSQAIPSFSASPPTVDSRPEGAKVEQSKPSQGDKKETSVSSKSGNQTVVVKHSKPPTPSPSPAPTTHSISNFNRNTLRIGGVAVLLISLLSGGGYLGYREIQRRDQKAQLVDIEDLRTEGDYKGCIDQAESFPDTYTTLHDEAIEVLDKCANKHLDEAEELAAEYSFSSFLDAVELTYQIPSTAVTAHERAQKLAKGWHRDIFQLAEDQYRLCQVEQAIEWVEKLPENSEIYQEVQKSIETWSDEWTNNQTLLASAEQILEKDDDWKKAQEKVDELTVLSQPISENSDCWEQAEIKPVTNAIARVKQIKIAQAEAERAEAAAAAARARNPLNASDRLVTGGANVSTRRDNGTLYRDYEVYGAEGTRWNISMQSSDFDTYLSLIDPNGREIARDDDRGGGYNSYLESVILPETGTYRVRANAYHLPSFGGEGSYKIIVTKID